MIDTTRELVSTGYIARRVNRSISGIKKLVDQGRIPPGVLITGSGRRVWRIEELPAIEAALRDTKPREEAPIVAA